MSKQLADRVGRFYIVREDGHFKRFVLYTQHDDQWGFLGRTGSAGSLQRARQLARHLEQGAHNTGRSSDEA